MKKKICPYCGNAFCPSRYHPGQGICSSVKCQRRRRANYHQKKLREDPGYRDQCRDSQKKWREKNPTYLATYLAGRRVRKRPDPERLSLLSELEHLLHLAKNNVAMDAKPMNAMVWILGSPKNTFAVAQVIVLYEALRNASEVPSKRTSL